MSTSRIAQLVASVLVTLGAIPDATAARQSVPVELDVPGIGQGVASGVYFFKFAIVDSGGGETYWSHDGTSSGGGEPNTSVAVPVEAGKAMVVLGDPPTTGQPDLTSELLERTDVVLRVWVSNGNVPRFVRLPDRRLRGKGFAHAAERARNSDRLQGKQAADFEATGTVLRHEERYEHFEVGTGPPLGRFYTGSTEIGISREVKLHFDVPHEEMTAELTLHASAPTGPPAITDLRMQAARVDNQPVDTAVNFVDFEGPGWFAGLRETYDYCNSCFKRKLPPEIDVYLDGTAFDAWKASRQGVPEGATNGRVDNLALVGLVRFDRSLRVRSTHRGADDATGTTHVWYYTETSQAKTGSAGAMQILLDGGDITPALVTQPGVTPSVERANGAMVASRFDGLVPAADELSPRLLLGRNSDRVWLTTGAAVKIAARTGGTSVLLLGEVRLAPGVPRFALSGSGPALLEVLVGGQYEPAVALTEAGDADAAVAIESDGWYPVRLAGAAAREAAFRFTIDGVEPTLRTTPLLGGAGDAGWSAGPIDFAAAGLVLTPGPHVLTFRNRGNRNGHLEYGLQVLP